MPQNFLTCSHSFTALSMATLRRLEKFWLAKWTTAKREPSFVFSLSTAAWCPFETFNHSLGCTEGVVELGEETPAIQLCSSRARISESLVLLSYSGSTTSIFFPSCELRTRSPRVSRNSLSMRWDKLQWLGLTTCTLRWSSASETIWVSPSGR